MLRFKKKNIADTVHTKYYYIYLQLLTCASHTSSSIKAHSHYPYIHLSIYHLSIYLLLPVLILCLPTLISCQRHSFAPLFITFITLSFTFIYSFFCFFFVSYSFFFFFFFFLWSHLFLSHDIFTTILLLTIFSLNLHIAHRVSRDSLEDIFTVILPPPSSSA